MMTVGQLRKRLENYPDEMPVILEHSLGLRSRQLMHTSADACTVTHVCLTTSHNDDLDAVGQMRRCYHSSCSTAQDAFRIA